MRIAAIADVHAGNHLVAGGTIELGMNERCRLVVQALERAVTIATHTKCDHLVVLGDLFDTHRPIPQLVAAVARALNVGDESAPRVWVMRGNHDARTDALEDDAISSLGPEVHALPAKHSAYLANASVRMFFAPHERGRPMREVVREAAEYATSDAMVRGYPVGVALAFHAGLQRQDTPPFLCSDTNTVLLDDLIALSRRAPFLKAVFCGDWHEHFHHIQDHSGLGHHDHLTHFVQVGSLCPTGFDEPGLDFHGVVVWERLPGVNRIEKFLVPGPRFLKARVPDEAFWKDVLDARAGHAERVYASLHPHSAEETARCYAELASHRGFLDFARVVPDERSANHRARALAVSVQNARSLDEAMRAFIAELSLPSTVTHDEVFHRCRALLAE